MIQWSNIDNRINSDNDTLLRHRNCPVCSEPQSKLLLLLENFQFFSDSPLPKQVDIAQRQCVHCGAIYMNPCYSQAGFEQLFEEAGKSYGQSDSRPFEQTKWLYQKGLLQNDFRLIDVGCGTGGFLSCLPENIKKTGVDIDLPSIEAAQKEHPHIEFVCSDFDTIKYDRRIDVITMFHVLEHLPTPKKTLQRLHKLAHNKTRLVIEVPIIENGLTNDINGFFSAQHLTHFSSTSLRNILQASGWEIIDRLKQNNYNGYRVLAEKSKKQQPFKLSNKEIENVYNYLHIWYKSLSNVEKKIESIDQEKCVIWGGGMHLEFLYQMTSLFKKRESKNQFVIVDSDTVKQGKKWRGINIYSPNILTKMDKNTPVIVSSYGGQQSIYDACIAFGKSPESIITLYEYVKTY